MMLSSMPAPVKVEAAKWRRSRMRRAYVEICWADYYARAYDVPLEFAQAVIDVESGWHPYVISSEL
jgi:soluble lytic murein transglycosylase-like protein